MMWKKPALDYLVQPLQAQSIVDWKESYAWPYSKDREKQSRGTVKSKYQETDEK